VDAAEFIPAARPPQPVGQAEVMPRLQGFLTAGHPYRGIEQGLGDLASRLREPVLFAGEPRAQATPDRFRWPQLIAVTDLASARAALDEIIGQGEGARGTGGRRITAGSSVSGTNTSTRREAHYPVAIEQGYATAQWIAREGAANQLDPARIAQAISIRRCG
jgi:hypothetical protein